MCQADVTVDRRVEAVLDLIVEAPSRLAVQIAVACPEAYSVLETVEVTSDDRPVSWTELDQPHGVDFGSSMPPREL